MGSFTRVQLFYVKLETYFSQLTNAHLFGTFLNGQNVHQVTFPKEGYLLIGNESNGISKDIEVLVNQRITIPRFGLAESLNASVATAIVLDNWRRAK